MVRTIWRSYFGVFAGMVAMVLLCAVASASGAAAGDTRSYLINARVRI
jgi:hypothetical protein